MKNTTFIFEPTNWKTKYDFEGETPEKKEEKRQNKAKIQKKNKKKQKTKAKLKMRGKKREFEQCW